MFNKGSIVTLKLVTGFFKDLVRKINGLSNVQLTQLTSGQFQYTDSELETSWTTVSDIMNVWSSQYFDRESQAYTTSYGSTTLNYMRYYTTKATELGTTTTIGEWRT